MCNGRVSAKQYPTLLPLPPFLAVLLLSATHNANKSYDKPMPLVIGCALYTTGALLVRSDVLSRHVVCGFHRRCMQICLCCNANVELSVCTRVLVGWLIS
jgi:hypothetical protein